MTRTTKQHELLGMGRQALASLVQQAGAKPVHAERLLAWVFRHGVTDPRKIPELPRNLRHFLQEHVRSTPITCSAKTRSSDGTIKLLLSLRDGSRVESVLIPGPGRLTQCISTQVGCAMGCAFCLTATAGLTRHLTTAEMVAQVMQGQRLAERKIRNLVLMGMGEPLHNFAAVSDFVRIVTDPKGMAFSPNRVTLSTAGLVPGIRQLIRERIPCNLAVSLNATTDEVRSSIMPINRKYPIAVLMQAVREYLAARGRKRVLIEYVLLAGINDSLADAHRLCALLEGMDCTVNLLPFNEYPGARFQRPKENIISTFREILVSNSIVAVVRESRGRDIRAACGQLKSETACIPQRSKTQPSPVTRLSSA